MNINLLKQAEHAYNQGKYKLSINIYKDAIEEGYDPALIYQGIATSYYKLGQDEQVIVYGEKAIALNPDLAITHLTLGKAYAQLYDTKKAESEILAAIALGGELSEAYTILAAIKLKQGNYSEAEKASHRAIKLDPHSWLPHFYLALVYGEEKRYSDTRRELIIAFKLKPTFRSGYFLVLSYYYQYVRWISLILILSILIGLAYKKVAPMFLLSLMAMINGVINFRGGKRFLGAFQFFGGILFLLLSQYLYRLWTV